MTTSGLPHRFPPRSDWPDDDPEFLAWTCRECGQVVSEMKPYEEQPGCTVDWHKRIHGGRLKRAWRELSGR